MNYIAEESEFPHGSVSRLLGIPEQTRVQVINKEIFLVSPSNLKIIDMEGNLLCNVDYPDTHEGVIKRTHCEVAVELPSNPGFASDTYAPTGAFVSPDGLQLVIHSSATKFYMFSILKYKKHANEAAKSWLNPDKLDIPLDALRLPIKYRFITNFQSSYPRLFILATHTSLGGKDDEFIIYTLNYKTKRIESAMHGTGLYLYASHDPYTNKTYVITRYSSVLSSQGEFRVFSSFKTTHLVVKFSFPGTIVAFAKYIYIAYSNVLCIIDAEANESEEITFDFDMLDLKECTERYLSNDPELSLLQKRTECEYSPHRPRFESVTSVLGNKNLLLRIRYGQIILTYLFDADTHACTEFRELHNVSEIYFSSGDRNIVWSKKELGLPKKNSICIAHVPALVVQAFRKSNSVPITCFLTVENKDDGWDFVLCTRGISHDDLIFHSDDYERMQDLIYDMGKNDYRPCGRPCSNCRRLLLIAKK